MKDIIHNTKLLLDQSFSQKASPWHLGLLDAIDRIGDTQKLVHLIDAILNDDDHIARCASLSYEHSNGFDKIVLVSSESNAYKLRLHVWWTDIEPITENAHNHRWNFATKIVLGGYAFEEFEATSTDGDYFEYRYFSPEGKDTYPMEFIGKRDLFTVRKGFLVAGTSYALHHEVIHRITNERKTVTASLLCQGAVDKSSTRVFAPKLIPGSEKMSSKHFTKSELQKKLSDFVLLLQ